MAREKQEDRRIRLTADNEARQQSEWAEFLETYHTRLLSVVFNTMGPCAHVYQVRFEDELFSFRSMDSDRSLKLGTTPPQNYDYETIHTLERLENDTGEMIRLEALARDRVDRRGPRAPRSVIQ